MSAEHARGAAQRLRAALDPTAPVEFGTRIATLHRSDREELRVTLSEWEGERYVNVRLWRQARGRWFPDPRRGLSVRVGEFPDLLDALSAAADCITALLANQARAQPDESGPGAPEAGPATAPPTRRRRAVRDAKGGA